MDKDLLAKIAQQNKTAESMFEYFRTRERNPKDGVMDFKRTKLRMRSEGVDVIPEEFLANFKALERAGVGTIVTHNGKPTGKPVSFRWTASMRQVASSIEDAKEAPRPVGGSDNKNDHSTNVTEIAVVLGPDRDATLLLPPDLTSKEAELLFNALMRRIKR